MHQEYLNTLFRIPQEPPSWPAEFVIVTAFNPEGASKGAEQNHRFDSELTLHLQQTGLQFWRVNGGSPDFSHVEPGYAVETDLQTGLDIGKKFRQIAIFWIKEGNLILVDCASGRQTPM